MPVDPSIALGVRPAQFDNPLAVAMQMQQFRASQESAAALAEQRRQLAEQRERATADQASLDQAVVPGATLDSVLAKLPGHMHAAVRKQWGDADKAAQDALDAKTKAASAEADYFGTLAATVKSYGYDPGAAQIVLAHAKAQGHDTAQIDSLLQQNPAGLKGVVDGLIAASPKQRELANNERSTQTAADRLAAEKPGIVARGEVDQQVAAGTVGGVTPAQKLVNDRAAEQTRIERARLEFEKQKANDAKADVTQLTPEGLDAAAMMFAKTGQLPPLGNGDRETRKKIINRAAVMVPGLDVASAKADFTANQESLKGLQKQTDALKAFESTALKNLDQFLELAKKVPDTGSPALNVPIRKANEKMFGSADLAAYNTARRTVIPEFAKILSNPGLSGQLSDTARKEIEDVVSGNATLKQTIAAANQLKIDAANRRQSNDDQIAAIQSRIKLAQQPGAVDTKAPAGPAAPFSYADYLKAKGGKS